MPSSAGTLALNADGSFAYTPGRGFQGTDGFTYLAKDGAGAASAVTAVSLSVPAGGGPTATVLTAGNDSHAATRTDDVVYGLGGDDAIDGLAGDDHLWGGAGRDRLIGNTGDDRLTGGPDADVFVVRRGEGNELITDFSTTGGDVVELPANLLRDVDTFAELRPHLSDVNGSAVLDLGNRNTVTFQGVATAQLAADDFLFV